MSIPQTIRTVIGLMLACAASAGSAQGIEELQEGQRLASAKVDFGKFKVQLPEGEWRVVKVLANDQDFSTGPAWLRYKHRTVFVARTFSSGYDVLLALSSLADSQTASGWGVNPCASYEEKKENYAFYDALDSRMFMPACLAVTKRYGSERVGLNSESWRQAIDRLTAEGLQTPKRVRRVFFSKFVVGNYFTMNLVYGAPVDSASFEAWSKDFARDALKAIGGDGNIRLSSFPVRTSASEE